MLRMPVTIGNILHAARVEGQKKGEENITGNGEGIYRFKYSVEIAGRIIIGVSDETHPVLDNMVILLLGGEEHAMSIEQFRQELGLERLPKVRSLPPSQYEQPVIRRNLAAGNEEDFGAEAFIAPYVIPDTTK